MVNLTAKRAGQISFTTGRSVPAAIIKRSTPFPMPLLSPSPPYNSSGSSGQQILRLSSSAVLVSMAAADNGNNAKGKNSIRAVGLAGAQSQMSGENTAGKEQSGGINVDFALPSPSSASADSLKSSFASMAAFQFDGNYEKLVIPLAGITLLSAFLLVLIINYFLHMRRNGFFKRHRHRRIRLDVTNQKSSDNTSSSNGGQEKERLVGMTNNAKSASVDATPDVTSNSDLPIDWQLALDLPPLPSPQLEYRSFFPHQTLAHQQLQQQLRQDSQGSPPAFLPRPVQAYYPPPTPPPKIAGIVIAAQQQLRQQPSVPQINSGSSSPVTPPVAHNNAGGSSGGQQPPASPKNGERRAGILTANKRPPSMSSLRSHSNNNSFNNRGSSDRILSIQESFDSAYEVRLYDESTVDTMSTANSRTLSKRAPLLKGESLSDDQSLLTPLLGQKKGAPQTLMLVTDSSNGPYFSRQPSVGGDLSPVQEQPTHDEQSNATTTSTEKAIHIRFSPENDTQQPDSLKPSNRNGKLHLKAQSPTSPEGASPKHQKSLLSIFKEKRVNMMEQLRAMSPTTDHPQALPHAVHHEGKSMGMATRPTDLLHHGARHQAPSTLSTSSSASMVSQGSQGKMMGQSLAQQGMITAGGMTYSTAGRGQLTGGMPGRGRARVGGGSGGISGPINANMLMGRVGGRGGDS